MIFVLIFLKALADQNTPACNTTTSEVTQSTSSAVPKTTISKVTQTIQTKHPTTETSEITQSASTKMSSSTQSLPPVYQTTIRSPSTALSKTTSVPSTVREFSSYGLSTTEPSLSTTRLFTKATLPQESASNTYFSSSSSTLSVFTNTNGTTGLPEQPNRAMSMWLVVVVVVVAVSSSMLVVVSWVLCKFGKR